MNEIRYLEVLIDRQARPDPSTSRNEPPNFLAVGLLPAATGTIATSKMDNMRIFGCFSRVEYFLGNAERGLRVQEIWSCEKVLVVE